MSATLTAWLPAGSTLVIATHNPGKLTEIAALITPYGIDVVSAGHLGLPKPVEDAPDFVGNARLKARAAAVAANRPALADDSGFCVAALAGAPGVVSARWAGETKDFAFAMERVHRELGDAADRRAWFICVLCLALPNGDCASFMGRVDGTATWPPRGEHGFGYDPIFVPNGETRTFAEMPHDEKTARSHRASAFAQFERAILYQRPPN